MVANARRWPLMIDPQTQVGVNVCACVSKCRACSIACCVPVLLFVLTYCFVGCCLQANKWVKAMERPHDLRVIKLTDSDYMRTLENAVQFGIPVLLENVGKSCSLAGHCTAFLWCHPQAEVYSVPVCVMGACTVHHSG
jgi:hypothetical protein